MSENEVKDAVSIAGKNAIEREKQKDDEILKLTAQLDSTKKALGVALDTIDSINRRDMIPIIMDNYNLPKADITQLSTDTMSSMVDQVKIFKHPAAGVRPGAAEAATDARFTVPSKFKYGRKED